MKISQMFICDNCDRVTTVVEDTGYTSIPGTTFKIINIPKCCGDFMRNTNQEEIEANPEKFGFVTKQRGEE